MARFRRPCISWTTIEAVLPEAAGEVTHFEPYFFQTNDLGEETGFFVVKGPMDAIFKIMEEDEYRALVDKAYYLVEHFKVDLLTVGDGITEQLERSARVPTARVEPRSPTPTRAFVWRWGICRSPPTDGDEDVQPEPTACPHTVVR